MTVNASNSSPDLSSPHLSGTQPQEVAQPEGTAPPSESVTDGSTPDEKSSSVQTPSETVSSPPSDPNLPEIVTEAIPAIRYSQVLFQSSGTHVELILPPESEPRSLGSKPSTPGVSLTWIELWQQLRQRLNSGQRFWEAATEVHLIAQDRLLDGRQLQAIADVLAEVQLQLKRVQTSRRQTAVAAATAGYSVDQQPFKPALQVNAVGSAKALADPLYVQMTLRSGIEIRHPGTVVVFGDVNPGSSIVADGDILVWGRLRGIAHAGANGNTRCLIAALQMEPTQLRIAQMLARAPSNALTDYYPEVAYITPNGICIMGITEFSKKSFPLLAELEHTGVSS